MCTEIKEVSPNGLAFIALEEGLKTKPYRDSVGIPTIGVGCTYYEDGSKVKMTDKPITKKRALELFANVLKHYELGVYSVTRDDINQNQFDALVSLCFNIGVTAFKGSTVLRLVNANPKDPKITAAFKMWKRAGKHPNLLLNRRIREAKLYFS